MKKLDEWMSDYNKERLVSKLKTLGNRDQYQSQVDDATVKILSRYGGDVRFVACGPASAAMAIDIIGQQKSYPGTQDSDLLMIAFHNPDNEEALRKVRDLDIEVWSPNEVPQFYPPITEIVYGKELCRFEWILNPDKIKLYIDKGWPIQISGDFPVGGHYVLIVGYREDEDGTFSVIFNDPYPIQWEDRSGFQREMLWDEMKKITVDKGKNFLIVYHG